MREQAEFDVIIYGATGFTGRLVAEYMENQYGRAVNWAMAGRSAEKLAAVRDEIGAQPTRHWWWPTRTTRKACATWSVAAKLFARRWARISFMAMILWRHVPNWARIMSICPANLAGCTT